MSAVVCLLYVLVENKNKCNRSLKIGECGTLLCKLNISIAIQLAFSLLKLEVLLECT